MHVIMELYAICQSAIREREKRVLLLVGSFPLPHLMSALIGVGSAHIPVPENGLATLRPCLHVFGAREDEMDDEDEDKDADQEPHTSRQDRPPLVSDKVQGLVHVAGGEQIGQSVQRSCR